MKTPSSLDDAWANEKFAFAVLECVGEDCIPILHVRFLHLGCDVAETSVGFWTGMVETVSHVVIDDAVDEFLVV